MFECRHFPTDVFSCKPDKFHVTIEPIEYIGIEEFRRYMRICRHNFMTQAKKWGWFRTFNSEKDATRFARHLARSLGELVFLSKNEMQIVTPREA